jgi:hypothetical protein
MTTAQTLIDEARNTLNDAAKDRFTDLDLLVGLNDGLKMIRAVRPDLWYGTLGTPLAALGLGSTFPLAGEYEPAIKNYVVHYAEMRDDEYVVKGRADAFLKLFLAEISKGL